MNKHLLRLMGALTLAIPALGLAQDAGTARTPAPELRYESAFAGYIPYEELVPADWRAVNDAVGQAARKTGGHAAEVSTPAARVKPAMSSAPSGSDDHDAHHGAQGGMK